SGGQKAFDRVAQVLRTNTFVIARVGSPVGAIVQGNGPSHVALGVDGRMHGFYSVNIEGPTGKESLKANWDEPMTDSPRVYAIYRTKAWAQDELVWGHETE